jgi:hypothetical protein
MYLRDLPGTTLTQFADQVNDTSEAAQVAGGDIRLNLTEAEPTIAFGNVEVPATPDGIEALGRHVKVPATFLFPADRAYDAEEAEFVLSRRLSRLGNAVAIHHTPAGIQGIYRPGQTPINPRRVVEVAMRVMDPQSPLIEYRSNADEMFFDVTIPLDSVTTGDPAVGDLTAAGLRFTQNRARNLTPDVEEFMYRLVCTNGMSLPDPALPKIDARELDTVEHVMAALEARAQEAFSRVEAQIAHFYDLRNQPIEGDVSQALLRIAQEQGLPDRTAMTLVRDRLPAAIAEGEAATMFHLINLITNEANNPAIASRPTSRRALEAAGGTVVAEHADRCTHCAQRLN